MGPRFRSPFFAALMMGLALTAAPLAGCGSSPSGNGVASKTPAEIVAAAKAAADAASSVYISGTIVSGGAPISLEMELLAGKGGRGRIAQSGLSFELIQVGATIYIDGSPAFYRHIGGPAAAQLFQGKWLKAPAGTGEFAPIAALTDQSRLMDAALATHGTLTSAGVTTVDGQKVVAIDDASEGGTLYIAATGKPFPIEVVKDGGKRGKVVFDRWDRPVRLVAPTDAIDVTKLQSAH
jgi:hypothetical protein